MTTVTDVLTHAADSDSGELPVVIGGGCKIGQGERAAAALRNPDTGELFLAAHLPCGCGCSDCYGIVHQFRVDDDGTDASLMGMGPHGDIRMPVEPDGHGLLITDGSGIDVIDARETPGVKTPRPNIEADQKARDSADMMVLYCLPEYEAFMERHPTEAPDDEDDE